MSELESAYMHILIHEPEIPLKPRSIYTFCTTSCDEKGKSKTPKQPTKDNHSNERYVATRSMQHKTDWKSRLKVCSR